MKNRVTLEALMIIIMVSPFIYVIEMWNNIPEKIAINFNIYGQPNGYASKEFAVLIFITINIMMYFSFLMAIKFNKNKILIDNSNYHKIRLLMSFFLSALTAIIFINAVNKDFKQSIMTVISLGICLVLSAIGNFLYSIKPNYLVGIRTPWTLNNEMVWRKTHQWASKIWFWTGLVSAVFILFIPEKYRVILIVMVATSLSILSFVYSYIIYKKEKLTSNLS